MLRGCGRWRPKLNSRTGQRGMIIITRTPPRTEYMDVCEVDIYGCFTNKYGDQCRYSCTNCKHGCDPDNGVCDSTHCNAGWTGPRCSDKECQAGYHGEHCDKTCPDDCKDNIFIQTNGYCACLTDTESYKTAVVGIGAGFGVLILVLVIIVIVQTRRISMKKKDTTDPIQMADILQQAKRHELKTDIDGPYEDVDTENGRQISKSATADENYEKLDSLSRTAPNINDTAGITVDAGS